MGDLPVSVVCGASGAIGSAVAADLDATHLVVRHGHTRPPAAPGEQGDPGALTVRADLRDWRATKAMAAEVVAAVGPPDLLVVAAGLRDDGLLLGQPLDAWFDTMTGNVACALHPVRALAPPMVRRRSGSIVLVTSVVGGTVASPGQTAYAAGKGALEALVRSLAVELGGRRVTVNAVAPGLVPSAMTADLDPTVAAAVEARQAIAGPVALEDVAAAVRFAGTTPALTGQVLVLDKGLSL